MRCLSRLRFSMRGLLLIVTVAGLLFATRSTHPHRQRRAVDSIRRLGGTVVHAARFKSEEITLSGQMIGTWQRQILGEQHFHVREIDLSGSSVSDADLMRLKSLTVVRSLSLRRAGIDGRGLRVLNVMPRIEHLDLERTRVTDSSLAHLRGLTNLRTLSLSGTPVDGTGLMQLQHLEKIEKLDLRGTNVTDRALMHLRGMKRLRKLFLDNTRVSDAGLAHLRQCLNLEVLTLENTAVTPHGVVHLMALENLDILNMPGLDLGAADFSNPDIVARKVRYASKSDVIGNPALLNDILSAWARRQRTARSLAITASAKQPSSGATRKLQFHGDAAGNLRLRLVGLSGRSPSDYSLQCRTKLSLFSNDSAQGTPVAVMPAPTSGNRISAIPFEFFPIELALRPLGGSLSSKDFELTSTVETVHGCECIVIYHRNGVLWVDPARDYVPLRYALIHRGTSRREFDVWYEPNTVVGWAPSAWTCSYSLHMAFGWEMTVDELLINQREP